MQQKKPTDLVLYLRLLSYVKPYLRIFLVAVVAMAVLALTSPAIAALFKNITEGVFQQAEVDLMRRVVLPLILVFFVAAVSSYVSRYALAWVAERLVMDLRVEMFKRLLQLSCADLDRHTGLAAAIGSSPGIDASSWRKRTFKIVSVDDRTGEVLSLKHRSLSADD